MPYLTIQTYTFLTAGLVLAGSCCYWCFKPKPPPPDEELEMPKTVLSFSDSEDSGDSGLSIDSETDAEDSDY